MYEIWAKKNFKLIQIEESEDIKNINLYKRGVYEFTLDYRPKCKICGSDLKFIKKGKKLIIDKCLNDNCETNNINLKKGAPIKWKAFVPDNLIKDSKERRSKAQKYSLTLDYYLNKGYTKEEGLNLLNNRLNRLSELGKSLKGVSQKQKLINKYGEELANKLLKERSCLNINFYTNRGYTEEEAKKIIFERQSNNSKKVKHHYGLTKEMIKNLGYDVDTFLKEKSCWSIKYYLKRGYTEDEAIKKIKEYQSYNSNLIPHETRIQNSVRRKEHWIKLGYTEDEAKEIVKRYQTTFSKEICIQKYGEVEGLRIFNKRQQKWQLTLHKNCSIHCGYSKISQDLFNELAKHTNNEIYYGSLNREYSIYNKENKHVYVFDFTDLTNKKIIEFQGDIYHANPNLFLEDDKPSPWNDLTSKELWERDEYKKQIALNNNFDLIQIWESDFRNNKEEIIKKCIKFLNYE